MKITEIEVKLDLPRDPSRSEGQHISGVIRCMATETGVLKAEWAEELSLVDLRDITDPVAVLRISIGLAWERYYIPMIEDAVDHPYEIQFQNIYMTHDGESLSVIITETGPKWALIVHEVKATYKSTRTVADLEKQLMWMWQIKSYCKALNTTVARLHVLFLCGDYTYPIRPLLKVWQLEFTQEEIDQNWAMMMQYLEYRKNKESET